MFKLLSVLLFPVFAVAIITSVTLNAQTNETIADGFPNWGDGTEAFYNELIKNSGNWDESAKQAIFDNKPIRMISKEETESILATAKEEKTLAMSGSNSQVLGTTNDAGQEKWIEVDLSDFKLYAWEGDTKVFEFSTSTGRRGYETPTGEFSVWRKVRSQRYKGGTPGTSSYYNLPNVPYSLFFYNDSVIKWKGYAIHGAYWHTDFGEKNRSSGCVNLSPMDAGRLYTWAGPNMPDGVGAVNTTDENPGPRIVIHE
jgi:lipoprotein-anchoring transpeptidase ErfK/SrfK